ncbi:MAG: hypothetical protein LKG27_05725 [Clostridiaceae bacterium]|jgi:DNA-binding CsgD family transcriptional regulator|nr:hypothetical protein [Clostridiaceae bacterium]
MSEYLSKEEIKQWRSSLEKITLEEYAARLGKKIVHEQTESDLIDIVFKGNPTVSSNEDEDWTKSRSERLSSIAERSFNREKEISVTPFSAAKIKAETVKEEKAKKPVKKPVEKVSKAKEIKKPEVKVEKADNLREEVRVVLKKALTDREQKVFDYFSENTNKIVYAKDLATLLDLPRDYVYKYIKNLRAKIEGDKLKNADKGGFILSV